MTPFPFFVSNCNKDSRPFFPVSFGQHIARWIHGAVTTRANDTWLLLPALSMFVAVKL